MKPLRHSAAQLLVALGLLFVSAPFVEDLPHGELIEPVLLSLVMIFAVLAVGPAQTLIVAVVLVIPALAAKWVNHVRPDLLHPAVFLSVTIAFLGFVVAQLLRFIVRVPRVDANVLCAGVSGFLMLGLLWVPLYVMVVRLNPGAFSLPAGATMDGFNAFFFSFVTLCTVGYGDFAPVSRVARMLAVAEAITGIFYMAVLISRLVSLYSSNQSSTDTNSGDKP